MSVNFYYPALFDETRAVPQNCPPRVEEAVQEIYKACEGLGTNENKIIRALTIVSDIDRELVVRRYKQVYNQDLEKFIDSETSGDFGFLAQLLCLPLNEMEAMLINKACSGAGTNEKLLYPIVIGRTPEEMALLKRTYFERHNKDLGVVLNSELSGDFKTVIMAAIQSQMIPFEPDFHTEAKAQEDAEKLYKAGQGKWGTDEETFIQILFSSPPQYFEMLKSWYAKKFNNTIHVAVEKEFGGDAKKALLYYVGVSLDPYKTFAEHLESTMKGIGTDELGLSAAVVRFRPFLVEMSKEYERVYETSLKDRIKGETGGDYKTLLVALLDAPANH